MTNEQNKSFIEAIGKVWRQVPNKSDCSVHRGCNVNELRKNIVKEKTWEEPCPFCLIHIRKSVFPTDHWKQSDSEPTSNLINFYLKFLTYPSPRLDFYFQIFNQVRKPSEKQKMTLDNEVYHTVRKALKQDIWQKELTVENTNGGHSNEESDKQTRKLLKYRYDQLSEWYLQRYQIGAAWRMYRLGKKKEYEKLPENLPHWILFPFILLLIFLGYAAGVFFIFHFLHFNWIWGLAIGILFPAVTSILIRFLLPDFHAFSRLLLPQQLGAIIIGYFLLLTIGAEFWDFIVKVIIHYSPWSLFFPLILLLLICCYLYWEVKSQLGYFNRPRALVHALSVVLIGCLETLSIGCLIFHLFGNHMSSLFDRFDDFLVIESLCYEQMIFIATVMVLALFIGIFLQIFWQDKPITVSL